MDNEFAIYNFLTGIECENKKPTYDEAYDRAFQLAWKDMATHTLKYILSDFEGYSKKATDNKTKLKNTIKEKIKNEIKDLIESKDEFKTKHKKLCESFNDEIAKSEIIIKDNGKKIEIKNIIQTIGLDTAISIGQAQKLVNMIIKYLYIYYQLYSGFSNEKIEFQIKYYHAPIDSIILEEIGKSNIRWSKINDYNKYDEIQKIIREKAEEEYENSFIWELNIWNNRNK